MFGTDTGFALVSLNEKIMFFQTRDGRCYANVECEGHDETHPLPSKALERWVRAELKKGGNELPSEAQLRTFLKGLEAQAQCDSVGPDFVHRRVGFEQGKIYLDLGGWDRSVVQIGPEGWTVCKESPVFFARSKGMLELPAPKRGGSINALRRFINVDDREFILVVGWLLAVLSGRGPYPVLAITGEAGSAKSTTAGIVRMLVDPHIAGVSAPPKSEADLAISATNGRIVALDNLSAMPPWLSDAICRLATGGTFTRRRGQSDFEQETIIVEAPVILNGIGDLTPRADLADRTINISLDAIPADRRKPRNMLLAEFEGARAELLGALLDLVAEGLRNEHRTPCSLSRMADFEDWVSKCETACWPAGTFAAAYRENQSHSAEDAIDGDPVACGFRNFLKAAPFEGTHQELLKSLIAFHPAPPGGRAWPATPKALSSSLRRSAPNLRKVGVMMTYSKRSGGNRDRIIQADIWVPAPTAAASSSTGPKRPKKPSGAPQASLFPEGGI
jgi:hypothetical protein